jgi:MFS family permease
MDIKTPTPEMASMPGTGSTPSTEEKMDEPVEKKSLSFMLAYGSVMASAFISTMDTVIVATALPAIAQGLNARSNEAYWLGSGFLFAQAVSQPLYGTLSGVFGRKACFLFAMIVFTIASLFCATAQSIEWLIVARVVSSFYSEILINFPGVHGHSSLCQAIFFPVLLLSSSRFVLISF